LFQYLARHFQPRLSLFHSGAIGADDVPKLRSVIVFDEVHEFMDDHVVNNEHWCLNQSPVERNVVVHCARTPSIPTSFGPALVSDLLRRPNALKRGDAELRSALAECFGDETVGAVYERRKIALGITAVDMSTHRSWVFKTPHMKGSNHRDDPFTLVELCLASSAAPIYRSLAQMPAHDGSSGSHVFADGGLWANNPVLIGMIDALELAPAGQSIEIFSIGTVPRPAGDDMRKEIVHRSLLDWRFGAEAASLAIDAQEFAYHQMARMLSRHLDHPCTVVRFPRESVPANMMQYLDLDEVRPDALREIVNLARNDVNMTNSRCNDINDSEAALISRLFSELSEQSADTPTKITS
jgi:hypothetical protein